MKSKALFLSFLAFTCFSCDEKSASRPTDEAVRKSAPMHTEDKPASLSEATSAARSPIDPPVRHPVPAAMIRPTGTATDDPSWDTLGPARQVAAFFSHGISRIPKAVSDQILAKAAENATSEEQVLSITRQAAAWHHIHHFREDPSAMPDPMKQALLQQLATRHGTSWADMVPELDSQIAASIRVDALRAIGIPGMTPDASQDFLIQAIEKHAPDYQAILSLVEQHTRNPTSAQP